MAALTAAARLAVPARVALALALTPVVQVGGLLLYILLLSPPFFYFLFF